jgi:hypothetical protein
MPCWLDDHLLVDWERELPALVVAPARHGGGYGGT